MLQEKNNVEAGLQSDKEPIKRGHIMNVHITY